MTDRLERYRPIVREWDDFIEAARASEPVTLRVRRALVDTDALAARLHAQGFETEPVAGLPDYLRIVRGPRSVAQTLEHWLGFFHVQQAVMALPSLALAPRPGDRTLDLCAAPGGKTVHMAELMDERGPIVAVDPKEKRLRGLMSNVFRLGVANVLVIAADARELPEGARFDRVLVDAPCSAEGNVRRKGRLPPRTAKFQRYVTNLQETLLRRAIELTRPGGTVLYSTCTFAPEENERVVDRVLRNPPAPLRLEPVELDLPHAPGLREWGDERFLPEVEHAWRVYPHHMDSGGLFMARLRRTDEAARSSAGWTAPPPAFPGEEEGAARRRIADAVRILEGELGLDREVLARLGWIVRKENIWLQTMGEWPVDGWRAHGGWRVVSAGLRAFRSAGPGKETPSNQLLGRLRHALRSDAGDPERHLDLTDEELATLLSGESLDAGERPPGPVVLWHDGTLLGRGMVGRGGLRHEIPKPQARRLRAILGLEGSPGSS